jgi:hypothetical protein
MTAYEVKNYAGDVVIQSIADKTGVDVASTSLSFFGRGNTSFGQSLNTNLLHLMEHFNAPTAPTKPVRGQLYYDSDKQVMKICTDSTAGAIVWQSLSYKPT